MSRLFSFWMFIANMEARVHIQRILRGLLIFGLLKSAKTEAPSSIPSLGASVNGPLRNGAFSSSSQHNRLSSASKGRLNLRGSFAAWIPDQSDPSPWIQVDLGSPSDVYAVLTQGRQDGPQFTMSYSVSYSSDGENFQEITENGLKKIFSANEDKDTVVRNDLEPPIVARYVRLHPSNLDSSRALRFDLLGYPVCEEGFRRFRSNCYKFIPNHENFSHHQRDCMEVGGNLASVTSIEENNFLVQLSNNTRSWIGGKLVRNTDSHRWVDGSDWSFSSWRQREPNRWGDREFCVEINYLRPGWWNDHFCDELKPAICERAF